MNWWPRKAGRPSPLGRVYSGQRREPKTWHRCVGVEVICNGCCIVGKKQLIPEISTTTVYTAPENTLQNNSAVMDVEF